MRRKVLSAILKSAVIVLLFSSGAADEHRARVDGRALGGADQERPARWVPEFDPAAAGAIAAAVAGGGALIARRRRARR